MFDDNIPKKYHVLCIGDRFFNNHPFIKRIMSKSDNRNFLGPVKKNAVGYEDPVKPAEKTLGRKRIYGNKVKLIDVFEDKTISFRKTSINIYGKKRDVEAYTKALRHLLG